ncbi:putative mediator of RNA polymerase II transcription subunitb [Sesamum angolense]|uniref:Mediator of RNA polymerase II transcription subunitb n=1 Tax=Sesamum angolense TaxID=2727404 RepID=A0AAE1X416_9LAMI|nr:putative mediator of RNA polymerase II transcription subunitb [Sesamum angolense]
MDTRTALVRKVKISKSGIEAGGSKDTKESKVNSSSRDDDDDDDDDDDHREVMEMNVNQISNYSYGDVDALTDEIEEESQFFGEVLRIKEILDNNEEESDTLLFDSLRRLQLMPLSVETLKATEIGKSVNSLRKHSSKEIRNLVRTLIEDWKVMVDSWVNATAAIAGAEIATESVKTSVVEEEEGLPSPLDEGAFFATPTSMELSQFFDGMDDDGSEFLPCPYASLFSLAFTIRFSSRMSH